MVFQEFLFVLNGKYAVSGAQPVAVFENALQQTYKETVSPLKDLSGSNGLPVMLTDAVFKIC
jgi:hypothetical protein